MGVTFHGILRVGRGIEQEHRIERGKIYSRTWSLTDASIDEAVRLLQTDWSWWKNARAEKTRDLGDGRKEFMFHPVRFFNIIEGPPAFLVRFERTEDLADGGRRIHATLVGDFCGTAQYSARPGVGGTLIEMGWCGAEVRGVLRCLPVTVLAAIHCWREWLGIKGLRARLQLTSAR